MRLVLNSLLLFVITFTAPSLLSAQETDVSDHCATAIYNSKLEDISPETRINRETLQRKISEYIADHFDNLQSPKDIITIPVVVHVLWNTPEQNISDDQVWSQIFILNDDFRRKNPDTIHTPAMFKPVAADCGIEFCLAKQAPFDTAATSGIVRLYTSVAEFGLDNSMKNPFEGGSRAWYPKHYLNIWVCNLAGNYLGYAQYPGGPDSTDGVVIDYKCFGNVGTLNPHYNKGRTATHELGHWLNLLHIWGDDFGNCEGSDYVDDTPNAADANYYCPTHPRTSNCNTTGEMFMNYMDYVDDHCFNLFTLGQRDRMLATISIARPELPESEGCLPYTGINEISQQIQVNLYPNPANTAFTIGFILPYPNAATVTLTDVLGNVVYQHQAPEQSDFHLGVDMSTKKAGVYFLHVRAGKLTSTSKLVVLH